MTPTCLFQIEHPVHYYILKFYQRFQVYFNQFYTKEFSRYSRSKNLVNIFTF